MIAWYPFPQQSQVDRVLPKTKIYSYAKPSRSIRERFVEEVDQIIWKYKLSPETINLPATRSVPEIQIFGIVQRTEELDEAVLQTIDKAILFPIFYELSFRNRLKITAAYKRPSDADSTKWVVDSRFESPWFPEDAPREPLPVALNLGSLYEQMLRRLIEIPARAGESLKSQVARIKEIRGKRLELDKLEQRLRREKQFNRKVELNRELRQVKDVVERLIDPQMTQRDADSKQTEPSRETE